MANKKVRDLSANQKILNGFCLNKIYEKEWKEEIDKEMK